MHALRADCHAHVFCRGRFAYAPDATYEPHASQAGSVARFLAVLDAHGLTHGLLVGPEPYGTDNRCLLESLAAAKGRLKGIALVKPGVADRELAALAARGVVGIRFNLSTFGMSQFVHPATGRLLARLREMGWFLQIHCEQDELVEAAPIIRRAGVRVIVDHFGRPDVARGIGPSGLPDAARARPLGPRRRQALGPVPLVGRAMAVCRRRALHRRRDRGVHARALRLGLRLAFRAYRRAHRLRSRARLPAPLAAG